MAVNVPGAISVFLFYSVILVTGLWASWKEKRRAKNTTESVVLAGRNIGLGLGTLTMIGTVAHYKLLKDLSICLLPSLFQTDYRCIFKYVLYRV